MHVLEVSQYLKVNVETVSLLIRNEVLPTVKVGGQWRFQPVELKHWIDPCTQQLQGA